MLKRKNFHFDLTLVIVAIVITASAIETDVFVPSFPAIQKFFAISESTTQMVLSINFLGLCVSSLFCGPLSDSYGRRPILLAGMTLFLMASIGCIISNSIEMLLFWRFIQGLGSSAGFVVTGAMIFDRYSSEDAAKVLGVYNTVITVAMSVAPIIGSYLTLYFSWRANFIFIGFVSLLAYALVLFFQKETLPHDKRCSFHLMSIIKKFKLLLMSRQIIISLTIICAIFGAYMIYIANLSLIFINHLKVDMHSYVFYQGSVLAVFAIVSLTVSTWINWLGMHKAMLYGLLINFVAACLLMLVAVKWPQNPLLITIAMCIFSIGFALMITIVFGQYMAVFPEMKGVASALCTSTRLMVTAGAIGLSGLLFNGSIIPVAVLVLLFSGFSMVAMLLQVLD